MAGAAASRSVPAYAPPSIAGLFGVGLRDGSEK